MEPEIVALWMSGASLVLQAISMIPMDSSKRTDQDEAALLAVSDAYYTTERYYEGTDLTAKPSIYDLAHKWEHAATLLRKYDASISSRLSAKSEFWRSGGNWSDDAIKQAGIGLQQIKAAVDERLSPR